MAAPRPIGAPSVPAVLLATVDADGVWTRGAIVMQASIPNVQIAFAPAIDESVKDLSPGTVTGLDLAIDGSGGLHAVWGSSEGLWYASGSSDPRSTMPWVVEKVEESPPTGLALAVDATGAPWLSYVSGGAVFVGAWSPVSLGDYLAGSNHVLPTGRRARFASGLSVLDFMKRTSFLALDAAGLAAIGPAAVALAEAEGLPAHARSVSLRLP